MTTPRKRPPSGFSGKPANESTEKQEIDEFLEVTAAELFEEVEKAKEIILEITPTEDPGPRFVETPPEEIKPEPPKVELKKPKRHARNTPRFSRTVK
jgi:hypothetical protein